MNQETKKTDLQRIQANLVAPKNQRNDFAKFNYRSCEDILQAVKPLLDELGCTLTLTDKVKMIGSPMPGIAVKNPKNDEMDTVEFNTRFYIVATATFTDSSGNKTKVKGWARESDHRKGMDASQLTGSTSSYARKYALSGIFLLDDSKDADSVLNITEAEIDAFTDMIEGGKATELFLMQAYDSEKYLALVKAATPKAGKVKFKEELSDLVMSAVASAETAKMILIEIADKDDEMGLREQWDEFSPDEKKVIWRQFNAGQQDKLTELLSMTKEEA